MSKLHWLALMSVSGIGGVTARKLIERFGDVEAVFDASHEELESVPRITADIADRLLAVSLDDFDTALEGLADEGMDVLTWDDDDYPPNLLSVNDAPPLLFMRGALLPPDDAAVAVVGSREATPQSITVTESLACALAERGLTVVSGLALGIDAAAHRGALAAEDGRTIAVLGSGLHAIFPRENLALAERIVERGALMSELRPNAPASGPSLMARDRIVSGLSRAVIVVEAREKSGTMDTVKRARTQNRMLLAVPGSPGTRVILEQGAERLDPQTVDLDDLARRIRAYAIDGEDSLQQPGLFS